jgi:2,3,4,5-tetrahydropyridine-2-carboxylate N-succinyltransferase
VQVYCGHVDELKIAIERISAQPDLEQAPEAHEVFIALRDALGAGTVRAAEKYADRWIVNTWVKKGILLGFRLGELVETGDESGLSFVDKDTLPVRHFNALDRVRVVPGGSAVRQGAYVAPSVICMPPMYINVGAYVDEATLVDSHALVGSCAQVGKRVHLSAGAQLGGVLEPVNAVPVVIEDDVLIGGNCGVYEGTWVRKGAVLGAGTILTRSMQLYDLVNGRIIRAGDDAPLTVPENAVVVPGARSVRKGIAAEWNIALYTPVIVKYRDDKTMRATELEELLR